MCVCVEYRRKKREREDRPSIRPYVIGLSATHIKTMKKKKKTKGRKRNNRGVRDYSLCITSIPYTKKSSSSSSNGDVYMFEHGAGLFS